ncbi:MAG: aldehyde dehydrogenase family protein [Bacteriovoracia bacterium]
MFKLPTHIPVTFKSSQGKFVDLLSPNDGKLLCKVQETTQEDIDFLLQETPKIQQDIKKMYPYERAAILKKAASNISENSDFHAWLIASEGGKPLKDAIIEVSRAVSTLELCAEETLRLEGEVVPMERTPAGKDHLAFTLREPIGPVLAISAFNHPLNLIAHQVGAALASGCSVVLKPAPATPLSAYFMEDAFRKAGLPEKFLRVVNAEIPLVEQLVSSSHFDFVSFIGSASVGWELRKKIAPGTRLALEHGGQAPAIIREDADLSLATSALVKGAFYHAGQVCISTQAIFVHESLKEQFLARLTALATKLKVGPATEEDTDVGPLIRPAEVVRLQKAIKEATDRGAKVILGNEVSGNAGQYLSPTILTDVPVDTSIMKDEAFGPVVCVNSYQDEEELLDYLNAKDYIFEASLFTQDISRAMRIARELSTMTLVINNHTAFRVDQMPFGGHKKSGLGMGGIKYAMEEMTRTKQVIVRF